MSKTRLGVLLHLFTSIAVILLGVLYIAFAAHLYFTGGNRPYSRERVGEYLTVLLIPSLVTVALAAFGLLYAIIKKVPHKNGAVLSASAKLAAYASRINEENIPEKTASLLGNERKKRLVINATFTAVSAAIALCAFIYLIFIAEFTVANLSADVMLAFAISLPVLCAATALHIPRIYLAEASAKREFDILKNAVSEGLKLSAPAPLCEFKNERSVKRIAGFAVLGIAAVLIILGITNGGMSDVLGKAIKICTECIGLG